MTIIGVIGGGQLGRMLALDAAKLDIQCIFLDPHPDCCATKYGEHILAKYTDKKALAQLIERSDVITFEFESVPSEVIEYLSKHKPTFPSSTALKTTQDRWLEKQLFNQLHIPTAQTKLVDSQKDLEELGENMTFPAVLKTRTLGYDGKGQKLLLSLNDVTDAYKQLGAVPMILEEFIAFDYEVSCITVRNKNDQCNFYPLVRNEHRQGILHQSHTLQNHPLQKKAEQYCTSILKNLDYIGVMAFEFFVKDDMLIANEIAPRVHNSGHWSIEGALCSQFENHIRAICDLPLGSCHVPNHVAMVNLIGALPNKTDICAIPGATYYDYGKTPKPGRKVGHITLIQSNISNFKDALEQIHLLVKNKLL